MRSAMLARLLGVSTGPPLHGATGTPAFSASRLASILSPSARMTVGVGADEDDAEPLAQVDELGVLGDEAPADPGGVGARLVQRPLEAS